MMVLCFRVKNNLTCHLSLCLVPLTNPLRQVSMSRMSMRRPSISKMSSDNCLMKVMGKTTTLIKMRRKVIMKRLSSRRTTGRNRLSKPKTTAMSSRWIGLWSSISTAMASRTLLPKRGDSRTSSVCHLQTPTAEKGTVATICRLSRTLKRATPWWSVAQLRIG